MGSMLRGLGGCIFKWILVVGWEPTGSQVLARSVVNLSVPGPYTNKQTVGYRIQTTGYRIQDTGYRIHRIQDAGYKIHRIQDAG